MISSIVVPIIVLGVLIFVHEFGHFIVAKACGVGVVKFSIGFGPSLYKFRYGETTYQVSAIPLGGFVRMVGDIPDMITGPQETDEAVRGEDETEEQSAEQAELTEQEAALLQDRSRWFVEKSLGARSAIVFAGPLFNFLLAGILIFLSVLLYGEEFVVEEPVIGSVAIDFPAHKIGIRGGDEVISLNGSAISSWAQLADTIRNGTGEAVTLEVRRAGEPDHLMLDVEPILREAVSPDGTKQSVYQIGIGPQFGHREASLWTAIKVGALWTARATWRTCEGLWGIVSGYVSPKELAGPIFIFGEASRQAERGLEDLLGFMAILSVSLAVLNLLPIPVLDGGHLLFFFLEWVFGPISLRKREIAQQAGMLFLLCLMGFAIHNDIFRDPATLGGGVKWEEAESNSDEPDPGR